MENRPHLQLLDDEQQAAGAPAGPLVRRSVDLPVRQEVLHVATDVPDRPVRLAEIVPLVHQIDERLVAIYLRHARHSHREVFCRKGCSFCCDKCLIVYSPAEMYYICEVLRSLPREMQRHVGAWLEGTADKARQTGLIDRLRGLSADDKPLDIIERWWREQDDTACPFLTDGACGIYAHRFVICREYYSQAPPDYCARMVTARMPVPLNLIDVLWQLEQRLTGKPCGALSLPFMKLWADLLTAEAARTWPALEMVEALFAILSEAATAAQRLGGSAFVPPPEPGDDRPPGSPAAS